MDTRETKHVVTEQKELSPEGLKMLFSSFLKMPVESLDFEIRLLDNQYVINTNDQKTVQQLSAVLKSPEATRASLSYTVEEITSSSQPLSTTRTLVAPYCPESTILEHGKLQRTHKRLFGQKILKEVGQMVEWKGEVQRPDCYVLYAESKQGFSTLENAQIEKYKIFLKNARFLELRQAIALKKNEYLPLQSENANPGVLARYVDNIIYIKKKEGSSEETLYFDLGLLVNCVTSPLLTVTEASQTERRYEIRIDKTHLMNYLTVTFDENFVLHLTGNETDQQRQARVICFNMQRTIPVEKMFVLDLDCSNSMAMNKNNKVVPSLFENYIAQVKQFIRNVAAHKEYANAKFRVTGFWGESSVCEGFFNKDLTKLYQYLDGLRPGGWTRLDGTIADTLQFVDSEIKKNGTDVTVVHLSDGGDNKSTDDEKKKCSDLSGDLAKSTNPPKCYMVGKGELYNKEKLEDLARKTAAEHIALGDDINVFSGMLTTHLNKMGQVRMVARFVQEGVHFSIPAYANELSVSSSSSTLIVPGNFSVGDRRYHAELGSPQLVQQPKPEVVKKKQNHPPTKASRKLQRVQSLVGSISPDILLQITIAKLTGQTGKLDVKAREELLKILELDKPGPEVEHKHAPEPIAEEKRDENLVALEITPNFSGGENLVKLNIFSRRNSQSQENAKPKDSKGAIVTATFKPSGSM